MKRYIYLFVCCLFFGLSDIDALIYVKDNDNICTETEDYIKWKSLPASKKENSFMPVKCVESLKRASKSSAVILGSSFNVDYKTAKKFSLLEQNKLTPIKDQKGSGLCWAFAANAVVESAYLIEQNKTIDLSEKHIDFNTLRTLDDGTTNEFGYSNRKKSEGGQFFMTGTYLASGRGPVLQSKLPWSTTTATKANTLDLKADYYVSDVDYLMMESCSDEAKLDIKSRLVNYGAVTARVYQSNDKAYLSSDKSSYYFYGNDDIVNHAVAIVGWDDDYSASNFVKAPAGNGAWLVRDSNPEYFGGGKGLPKGYYYISYYDANMCSVNMSVHNITDKVSNNLYTFDKLGFISNLTTEPSTLYFKNVYTRKNKNEELTKISLFSQTDDQYEIYYSEKDDFNSATKIATKKAVKDSYTTIELSEPLKINSEKFYIYIKYTSGFSLNNMFYYPVGRIVDPSASGDDYYNYRITSKDKGVSFYSSDASSWIDTLSNNDFLFFLSINVFTDNYTPTVSESIKISSTEKSSENINSTDGGYFKFNLKLDAVNIDDVKANIYSKAGDVTSLFKVSKYDTGYKVDLTSKTTAGTYTIKFTYKELAASQSFTVSEKARETIYVKSINITGSDEVSVGGTLNLKAEVLPENADTKTVTWTSSNPSFATVDKNGIVKGYSEGSVTITATSTDGSNIKAYKLIKIIDINKEEGNGTTVIDRPNDDKDGSDNNESTTRKVNSGENQQESNPDTGIRDVTIVLVVITLISGMIILYIKKYNMFKEF